MSARKAKTLLLRTGRPAVNLRKAAVVFATQEHAENATDAQMLKPWEKLANAAIAFADGVIAASKKVKPRARVPRHGPCECDAPVRAHDVRKLKICAVCDQPGMNLIKTQYAGSLHIRCVFYAMPTEAAIRAIAESDAKWALCCVRGWAGIAKRVLDLREGTKGGAQ